jgi:hypothetical protein
MYSTIVKMYNAGFFFSFLHCTSFTFEKKKRIGAEQLNMGDDGG